MTKIVASAVALALAASLSPARADATADGAALYKAKCAVCHGKDGKGRTPLATPEVQAKPASDLERSVANGNPPKMPAYRDKLAAEEIQAVVAFIKTLH